MHGLKRLRVVGGRIALPWNAGQGEKIAMGLHTTRPCLPCCCAVLNCSGGAWRTSVCAHSRSSTQRRPARDAWQTQPRLESIQKPKAGLEAGTRTTGKRGLHETGVAPQCRHQVVPRVSWRVLGPFIDSVRKKLHFSRCRSQPLPRGEDRPEGIRPKLFSGRISNTLHFRIKREQALSQPRPGLR